MNKFKTKTVFKRLLEHLKKNQLFYAVFAVLLIGITTFAWLYCFKVLPKSYVTELYLEPGTTVEDLITNSSVGSQTDAQSSQSTGNNQSSGGGSLGTQTTPTPTPLTTPVATPTPAPETPTVVAFYGDSQSDTDAEDTYHQTVVNYILGTAAYTVFHAGDLLEDGTADSLNRFNNVTSTLRATRNFYSAQGNNERDSSVYFDNFSYPGNEHWFSINTGNLHMVVLDNYASSVAAGSEQYNWLAADLQSAASQQRITGVIFHYPVNGVGDLANLFTSYGVDFVIQGHWHSFQKAQINGVYYFVGTGQPSLGYMLGYIYSNRAEIYVYNSGNGLIDSASFSGR